MSDQTYGFGYRGMDPRDFQPDFDECTPEEIGRWQEAVARANAGLEWEDVKPPLIINGKEIRFYTGGLWGIGVTTWRDTEAGA